MASSRRGRPVRVGVLGAGWFGRIHLDAWQSVRGAEVVGICDTNPEAFSAAAAAQEAFHADVGADSSSGLPPDLPTYTAPSDLFEAGVDLVDVVVTEDQHATCVRAALDAHLDVVVEKPLALTLDEAVELVSLATKRDRSIFVAQVLRFDPRHIALSEAISTGSIRHLSLRRHFQTAAHDVYGRVHPILNASVHDIDLAVWLVGRAPDLVTGFSSHFLGRKNPDGVDLVMEWDDGPRAVIENSWHLSASCPYGFMFDCTVHTTEGTYLLRNEPVLHEWTKEARAPELFFWPRYADKRQGALVAELQQVADCVAGDSSSFPVPMEDALQVMSTCQAAIESLETNKRTRPVPLAELTGGVGS